MIKIIRYLCVVTVSLVSLSAPLRVHGAGEAAQAISVVQGFADAVSTLHELGSPDRERIAILSGLLGRYIDFASTAKRALGPYWTNASVDERAQFEAGIRDYLTKNLLMRLVGSTVQSIVVDPPANVLIGEELLVSARLGATRGNARQLGFRLIRSEDGYRIFDVIVSGVSTLELLGAQCKSIIRREGVRALVVRLAEQ